MELGERRWAEFYTPAEKPDQISLTRPFYPLTPGGTSKQHLYNGLGLNSARSLLRRCDCASATRNQACEIFWTLGANQVGRAAISGWRDVLAPAVRGGAIKLWPFDGEMTDLLQPGRIVVAETYPAEVYSYLGLVRNFGKRKHVGRQSQCDAILSWCGRNSVRLHRLVELEIRDGFGDSDISEDKFDTVVGLLGMIEVAQHTPRFAAPADPAVRNVEGWILGMPTESEPIGSALPEIYVRPSRSRSGPSVVVPVVQTGDDPGRICPACGTKRFVRWPWGWDAHAAHSCTGVQGETPEQRKKLFKDRFLP